VSVTLALPAASVVAPATVAPATGAPVLWSRTVTRNGTPAVAVVGPASRRSALPNPSKTQSTSSPAFRGTWQPPKGGNCPLTATPQNAVPATSVPTRLIRKSAKLGSKVASHDTPESASAVVGLPARVAVGGVRFSPTSQGCGPPLDAVARAGLASVVTGPSNRVAALPSTRRLTVTGAAAATEAGTSSARTASARPARRWSMKPPLSTRAI
jgi:hypothetical protein